MVSERVVVLIVNWNGGAHLRRCLLALARQTERSFKAVVVDNGSTDGSAEVVEALGDSRFSLMRARRNLGFASGNNWALEKAPDSEWIALLNPDAFPEETWLERLLQAAIEYPDCGALGSRLVDPDDRGLLDGTGDAYHVSGRAWRLNHGQRLTPAALRDREIFSPCAAAAIYRRSAWVAAGGLDDAYFCYLEDVDLGFRMRLLGYRAYYVHDAICAHVGSATTGRHSDFASYHGQRNMVWTFVKNMPGGLFWLLLPVHLLANLAALIVLALRGQMRIAIRAKRDAVLGLPLVWDKRKAVQQTRTATAAQIWGSLHKGIPRG